MKKEVKKEVEQKTSKLAIASFILGVIGLLTILITMLNLWQLPIPILIMYLLSPFISLGSILLGTIGLVKVLRNSSLKGKWLCIIGILLGVIALYAAYYIYARTMAVWSTGF